MRARRATRQHAHASDMGAGDGQQHHHQKKTPIKVLMCRRGQVTGEPVETFKDRKGQSKSRTCARAGGQGRPAAPPVCLYSNSGVSSPNHLVIMAFSDPSAFISAITPSKVARNSVHRFGGLPTPIPSPSSTSSPRKTSSPGRVGHIGFQKRLGRQNRVNFAGCGSAAMVSSGVGNSSRSASDSAI